MFVSTRGEAPAVGLATALLAGIAPDGGLYMPAALPRFDPADFMDSGSLAETSRRLLLPFFAGSPLESELPSICAAAFDFPTPLVPIAGSPDFVLELFHGPTCAFKDIGARFLAQCMQRLRGSDSPPLTILVATSGDTGAAVAAAFHDLAGFHVAILYPDGRVSPRQAHQLGCFGGNVRSHAVAGSFDDCQALAKQALADQDLQRSVPLSSANSISLGRLLPQMAYYAHAAIEHLRERGTTLDFVVPTGNLGNAMAAVLARKMGLPVGRIVLATNANMTLPDFFAGGAFEPRRSVATLANAMDVGAPSNFERLRWLYPDSDFLRSELRACAVSDSMIAAAIAGEYKRQGRAFCPHTATALHVLAQLRAGGEAGNWAVVSTAHPAKFDSVVEPLVGAPVELPPALSAMLARPSSAEPLAADYARLRGRLSSLHPN